MRKLSTGDESTLGSYRKLAVVFFGEESAATAFIWMAILFALTACSSTPPNIKAPCAGPCDQRVPINQT